MKISKLFHWLYASVMFLPLLAIPVFMIYSHRHTLTERTNVEINYKYQTNEVNTIDDLIEGKVYHCDSFKYNYSSSDIYFEMYILSCESYTIDSYDDLSYDETYLESYYADHDSYLSFIVNDADSQELYFTNSYAYVGILYEHINITFTNIDFYYVSSDFIDYVNFAFVENYFSISDFSVSTYNEIESVNADTTNENVMNVFFKDFADFTDKYFNFDNVLSLHSITEWIDTNVFNGVTPLGFTIVWRYLEYWLIVSIFWLCFDVLIYVPQIAHRWLDKASLE